MDGMKLCGIGIPGELCTSGDGVAKGYLNNEDLTNDKFIDNPFGQGKLYRTGDLARWNSEGNIEFLGRIDQQIKLRGFRIELGEIENAISKQEGVKDVVVTVQGEEEKLLCGFVVSSKKIDLQKIRDEISKELPSYMIPVLMEVESLPLNKNGKVDKKKLPKVEYHSKKEFKDASSPEEKIIKSVFEEVLNIKKISVNEDYFDIGGDSIKSVRIVNKLKEHGIEIDIKQLLADRTIEKIAMNISCLTDETFEK